MKKTEKKYKLMPVLKRLISDVTKEYPVQIPRTIAYTILAGIYPLLNVLLPKLAIGILEENAPDVITRLCVAMAIYFVVAACVSYSRTRIDYMIEATNLRARIIYLCKIYRKLMQMDYCNVEDASFWEKNDKALNSCNDNVNGMEGMLNRASKVPAKVIALLGMVVLAAMLSPWVLLILIGHLAVMMWISRVNHNYFYAHKEEVAKAERKIKYYEKTSQDFAFGKDIRIYNLRGRILGNFMDELRSYVKLTSKLSGHDFRMYLLGIATLTISDIAMYGYLIYRAYHGMPISSFTMYITLFITLSQSLIGLGDDITFLQNEGEFLSDAFDFMDSHLTTDDKETITIPEGETIEIVFDHVDFKYPGSEEYVYKDLNFTIHKGERLAIVGVNGAGKSTLVKLMMGLFSPTAGHIYINGKDVEDFNKRDLYRIFSAVFQDVNVLAFSIRENVAGASTNVDDARVVEALKGVGLWDKVSGFERGLDQMMLKIIDENGTDFSGGERQKLSIARGLYKDAPMVVMDEPTAALDALAEAAIYESFSDMVKGKTAVYISHRLASTKFCDKIALFDKTGLIEYGTHDELMDKEGEYYRMFVVQGKYYQTEQEALA